MEYSKKQLLFELKVVSVKDTNGKVLDDAGMQRQWKTHFELAMLKPFFLANRF